MRRLEKRQLPANVASDLSDWQTQLATLLSVGATIPDALAVRYRWPPIKAVIIAETFGKCAYCESKIAHVYPGDVEHIRPKDQFPQLRLDYNNLTLACFKCNNIKRDRYDITCEPLNPYTDEPKDHLRAFGALIWAKPSSDRGRMTERLVGLNRAELVERRTERLNNVRVLVERYLLAQPGLTKTLLEDEIRKECAEEAEYSFVVSSYVTEQTGLAA